MNKNGILLVKQQGNSKKLKKQNGDKHEKIRFMVTFPAPGNL